MKFAPMAAVEEELEAVNSVYADEVEGGGGGEGEDRWIRLKIMPDVAGDAAMVYASMSLRVHLPLGYPEDAGARGEVEDAAGLTDSDVSELKTKMDELCQELLSDKV